jgi:polar amino acid transport system substrate-binding protein
MKQRSRVSSLALALGGAALGAVLVASSALALSLDEAKQNGIRLGFPTEPPNTYVGDGGKVTGAYNDLVVAVLGKIGVTKVEGVVMDFASLIPGLQANRLDVIPAIYIRPARCEQVAFSEPVERGGTAFLVLKGNPKNLHSYDDVKNGDAVVGVMAGAVEQGYATKAGIPEDRIMPLQDQASLMEALKTSRIDVVILTPSSVSMMADTSAGVAERAEPFSSPRFASAYGGIAFRKDDAELVAAFNAALKDFMATPEFMETMKAVNYTADMLPGDMTTAEACAMEQ